MHIAERERERQWESEREREKVVCLLDGRLLLHPKFQYRCILNKAN